MLSAGVMLSHPGDPLPSPSAWPSLENSRGKANKGDTNKGDTNKWDTNKRDTNKWDTNEGTLIKGKGCQGHPGPAPHALVQQLPLSHQQPCSPWGRVCSAHSCTWCGTVGPGTSSPILNPPQIVAELLSLQPPLRARCSPSFPVLVPFPARCPCPALEHFHFV